MYAVEVTEIHFREDDHSAILLPNLLTQTISFQHTSRQTSQSHTYSHTAQTQIIHPPAPLRSNTLLLRSRRNESELPGGREEGGRRSDCLAVPSPSLSSCLLSADVSSPAALPTLFRGSILGAELLRSITLSVCRFSRRQRETKSLCVYSMSV